MFRALLFLLSGARDYDFDWSFRSVEMEELELM